MSVYIIEKERQPRIKHNKYILVLLLSLLSIPDFHTTTILGSIIIISTASIIYLLITTKIPFNLYLPWLFLNFMFFIVSIFWAINPDHSINHMKQFIIQTTLIIFLSFLVKNKKDLINVMNVFIL